MTRAMLFVTGVLTGGILGVPSRADDPPKKLTAEEPQGTGSEVRGTGDGRDQGVPRREVPGCRESVR